MTSRAGTREAQIHFDLYYALKTVIGRNERFKVFDKVEPERVIEGVGRADLVLTDKYGSNVLVIETKNSQEKNDPYQPHVIDQALRYANWLGSHYFATCDGKILVLFDNKETGVEFWQRKRIPPYDLTKEHNYEAFAERLLDDILALESGTKKWSGLDEAFISRLKILHNKMVPMIYESLNDMINKESEFTKRYSNWLSLQGLEINEQSNAKVAVEATYMLLNKILFYKVLEVKYPQQLPKLTKAEILLDADAERKFKERLLSCFKEALKIDYRAVFQTSLYDDVKLPTYVVGKLNEFIQEASRYDISKIETDIIGQIYEGLIPQDERKKLGQYYTPPAICDLIVRLCIRESTDLLYDPSCGTGGFLVKAYHRLLSLRQKKMLTEYTHQEILHQLWGSDISQFPAHLTVINLAMRNIHANSDIINVLPSDFFRIRPQQKALQPLETGSIDDEKGQYEELPLFDAVVCNPPYTRQDDIGDEKYKAYVRRVALGDRLDISQEAGIYAYFFTHSANFLKERGMFGYIVSNSWMDARFGRNIQKFFLDNFKIIAILEFDKRSFVDAAINTVILIAEKLTGFENAHERNANQVRFIRIKSNLKTEQIEYLVTNSKESFEDDRAKITMVLQEHLYDDNKWMKFLRAPEVYFASAKKRIMTPLKNLAEINVGIITFANDFFVLSKETAAHWNIEKEFLKPLISNTKDITTLDLDKSDVNEYLFYVDKSKDELQGTNALRYIEYGESKPIDITRGIDKGKQVQGYHNIPSFKGKSIWYAIKPRKAAPILVPDLMWERNFATWNKIGCFTTHAFYELHPHDEKNVLPLLAFLNSSVASLYQEVLGRTSLGEGAIRLMGSDWETLPVIDITKLDKTERKKLEKAFLSLASAVRGGSVDEQKKQKKKLDEVVYSVMGLNRRERLQVTNSLLEMKEMRKNRVAPEVLIDHPETKKRKKKPSKEFKKVENERLSKWLDQDA